MKLRLDGSGSPEPAIRAAALAEQLRRALWAAGDVPIGAVTISFGDCHKELAELRNFVFGGKTQ